MRDEFQTVRLNIDGAARLEDVREVFSACLDRVEVLCVNSRERSLAITKLQEAEFWASRAIAMRPENRE